MARRKWFPFKREERGTDQPARTAPTTTGAAAPARMGDLQQEINRVFDQFFGADPWRGAFALPERFEEWFGDFAPTRFQPSVDVADEGKHLKVTAEFPGMDQDDVDVRIHDNALMLEGEKKLEETRQDEGYYRTERSWGRFERVVPLPVDVDPDGAEAQMKKSVLTVRLPKREEESASGRKIEVSGE